MRPDRRRCTKHGVQRYPISPRNFPRNTQYDHAVYIRITGSRTRVPISRKACVPGEDAACHKRVMVRHDHGPQADGDAEIGHQKQPHRCQERSGFSPRCPRHAMPPRPAPPSRLAPVPKQQVWPGKPARAILGSSSGVQMLMCQDRDKHTDRQTRPGPACPGLQRALGLDDQPTGAQQTISGPSAPVP